jgi:hypothetical protein
MLRARGTGTGKVSWRRGIWKGRRRDSASGDKPASTGPASEAPLPRSHPPISICSDIPLNRQKEINLWWLSQPGRLDGRLRKTLRWCAIMVLKADGLTVIEPAAANQIGNNQ